MEYKIRSVEQDDAPSLRQHIEIIVEEKSQFLYRRAVGLTIEEAAAFVLSHQQPKESALFVAITDNKIVGMLDAYINKRPQRSHCASFGMSVQSSYRNRGLGTALITELLNWAKAQNLKRVELEVFSNNSPAISLYEKAGFVLEGTKKGAVKIGSSYIDILDLVYVLG